MINELLLLLLRARETITWTFVHRSLMIFSFSRSSLVLLIFLSLFTHSTFWILRLVIVKSCRSVCRMQNPALMNCESVTHLPSFRFQISSAPDMSNPLSCETFVPLMELSMGRVRQSGTVWVKREGHVTIKRSEETWRKERGVGLLFKKGVHLMNHFQNTMRRLYAVQTLMSPVSGCICHLLQEWRGMTDSQDGRRRMKSHIFWK